MKLQLHHLIPKKLELSAALFISFVIILLANSKQLLEYYGLESSDQFIKSSAGASLKETLAGIDAFSATNSVVTFIIWAVVGIICFGIVEALGSGLRELKLQKQVSSSKYVHPTSFTIGKFWQGVALDSITLIVGLILLAVTSLLFLLLVIPLGQAYSRVFLFDTNAGNVLYLLLGLVIVFAGAVLVNIAVRFMVHRRRIFIH